MKNLEYSLLIEEIQTAYGRNIKLAEKHKHEQAGDKAEKLMDKLKSKSLMSKYTEQYLAYKGLVGPSHVMESQKKQLERANEGKVFIIVDEGEVEGEDESEVDLLVGSAKWWFKNPRGEQVEDADCAPSSELRTRADSVACAPSSESSKHNIGFAVPKYCVEEASAGSAAACAAPADQVEQPPEAEDNDDWLNYYPREDESSRDPSQHELLRDGSKALLAFAHEKAGTKPVDHSDSVVNSITDWYMLLAREINLRAGSLNSGDVVKVQGFIEEYLLYRRSTTGTHSLIQTRVLFKLLKRAQQAAPSPQAGGGGKARRSMLEKAQASLGIGTKKTLNSLHVPALPAPVSPEDFLRQKHEIEKLEKLGGAGLKAWYEANPIRKGRREKPCPVHGWKFLPPDAIRKLNCGECGLCDCNCH